MAGLDFNNDGKTDFSDLTGWLQAETFGIKRWLLILLGGAAYLVLFAPRSLKRKFGLK